MNHKFLSILIIEDDNKIRNYLNDVLSLHFKKIHVAQDGCVGLEMFKQYHYDVVVTDIKMPCMDGIELVKKIKNLKNEVRIIFCTAFSDKNYLMSAIDMRVNGYIVKPIDANMLIERIKLSISSSSTKNTSQKHTILSKREYEVFLSIAKGIKPIEIAQNFGIKPKTISTYRKRILEKMNFSSNADITKYAIKNNLI
jgi:DNA-binding NarL/FixJ family response regulator